MVGRLKGAEEALAAFEQVIQVDPQNGAAYTSKGNILLNLGRYQEALVAYETALTLDNDIWAAIGKQAALEKLKQQ